MYREVDINYIVQKMIKKIWIAVIVGLVGAVLFTVFSNQAASKSNAIAETYNGDYLQRAETNRYAVYAIYQEETQVPVGVVPSTDLSTLTGVVNDRLRSSLFSDNLYNQLQDRISDFNDSGITIKTIKDEMIEISIENNYVLTVKILSPSGTTFADDNSKKCKYRDQLFELATKEIEDGNLFSDLPIHLERSDKKIELTLSEEEFKQNYLETRKSVSIKHIIFIFLLGVALAEAAVIIAAILNNTVKSANDLSKNTDLLVLGEINQGTIDRDFQRLTTVLKSRNLSGKDIALVTAGNISMDLTTHTDRLKKDLNSETISIVNSKEALDNPIDCLSEKKVLLIVEPLVSNYSELDSIAKLFARTNTAVEGAVVCGGSK